VKFLLIIFILFLLLIYIGNYLDYRRQVISRKEFERRIRFFIVFALLLFFLFYYFK